MIAATKENFSLGKEMENFPTFGKKLKTLVINERKSK
jgi:hypothetical protein